MAPVTQGTGYADTQGRDRGMQYDLRHAVYRKELIPVLNSWIIQRLEPHRSSGSFLGKDNPFAFGGGLRNGGLSNEAMALLRDIFSFAYMGSAEFEFGAVPKALQGMAEDAGQLVASAMPVDLVDVPRHWRDKTKGEPAGQATIYLMCRREHLEEVTKRVTAWATSTHAHLKESTNLTSVLRPDPSGGYVPDTCGWLELDNGFFFFTDAEMWQRTCELFGVSTRQVATSHPSVALVHTTS